MQQRGVLELEKKKKEKEKFNFKSFMDLLAVKTNQSLGLALAGSAVQVTPTSPEILFAE